METIKHGAEAVIFKDKNSLIKERVKKGYRVEQIDKNLRRLRTKMEAKLIDEARRSGVDTPHVIKISEDKIVMEFIEGERIKEFFNNAPEADCLKVAEKIGVSVGKLHSAGIMHGDLTTSNMILRNNNVVFIDFGLGEFTNRREDYATDLSVFKEILNSTHFRLSQRLWETFIRGYELTSNNAAETLNCLERIEKRGRYTKRK